MERWLSAVFLVLSTVLAFAAGGDEVKVEETGALVPHWSEPLGEYGYDDSGNTRTIGIDTFGYDQHGRLTSATVSGHVQTYVYDGFGNRLSAMSSGAVRPCTPACDFSTTEDEAAVKVNPETNRLSGSGISYDADGRMTRSGGASDYAWSADGYLERESSADGSRRYIYNASGERIATYEPANGQWLWTLRDESGRVLREYASIDDPAGTVGTKDLTWKRDLIYRGSQLLGVETPRGSYSIHVDHLGTPRLIVDRETGAIVGRHKYLPFGSELQLPTTLTESPQERMKFTGHERDLRGTVGGERGDLLDYMHARYYSSNMGRFLSVDPEWAEDTPANPQKWNRYSYVTNNPMRYTDPDGRDRWDTANGFFNALLSNFGVTVRVEQDNADYQRGQRSGDQASVAAGGILTVASMGGAGTVTVGTGGVGAVTIPAAVVVAGVGSMGALNGAQHLSQSSGNRGTEGPKYKETRSGVSGKEAAKDAPSWAKGNRPKVGESGKDFATRLMNEKYGKGNWETKKGPASEFNQIKKWGDRGFQDPR